MGSTNATYPEKERGNDEKISRGGAENAEERMLDPEGIA